MQKLIAERYRLLQSLGSGGMGRVWLARDEVLRREVAIKEVVFPEGLTQEEREELCLRTLREARAAGRLSHANVVQIYDVVEFQGRPWIVMELIRSRSLYQVIKKDGPLSPKRAAVIGMHLLSALRAAHHAGVLHRDVKPGNVLLADDGRVVLTDFGLATFDGGDGDVTRSGLILGSAQYIAPERARDGVSGPESDMWSLGATLYAAVEGRSPYARDTSMATLVALATEPPDAPQRAGPLKPLLNGLLRKNPRARMGAKEAERLLRRVASGETKGISRRAPRQREAREDDDVPSAPLPATAEGSDPSARLANGAGGNGPVGAGGDEPGQPGRPRTVTEETFGAPRPRPRRWPWVVAVAGAVALSIPGVMLLLDAQGDGVGGSGGQPTESPAHALSPAMGPQACADASAPAGTPVPTATPSEAGEHALFDGRVYYRDPTGFRIPVFSGWDHFNIDSLVCFRDKRGGRVLAVDQRVGAVADPLGTADRAEEGWVTAAGLRGYQQVELKKKPIRGQGDGAQLEYTYVDTSGERMHGMNLYFATPERFYMIYWLTPQGDWPAQLSNFTNLTAGFWPA